MTGERIGKPMSARWLPADPGDRALLVAWSLFVLGFAVHTVGHVVNGMNHTPWPVIGAGSTAMLIGVWLLWPIYMGRDYTPMLIVVLGSLLVVALVVIHLPWGVERMSVPWQEHSDPHHRFEFVGWFSLASVAVSVAGTVGAVVIAADVWRRRRRDVIGPRIESGDAV